MTLTSKPPQPGKIGVFDSGYGGLTILKEIVSLMPEYDYLYLGDNARAPYGTRSFECVYQFTLQAVRYLFAQGCPLVILACNTASAKALRTIQQRDLPEIDPTRRVLGVIRPTVERLGEISSGGHIGILATPGTVASGSYEMEIGKLYSDFTTTALACPMWVPLVENRESDTPGADYFIRRDVERIFSLRADIDTLLLGCTHYPILLDKIKAAVSGRARIVSQGNIVAGSLRDYLSRHPEMDTRLSRGGSVKYLTTEHPDKFCDLASVFLSHPIAASHVELS